MPISITSANLYGDAGGWQDFVLDNSLAHQRIANAIYVRTGKNVLAKPIADAQNMKIWLMDHGAVHESELAILGQPGLIDLSLVDLSDEKQYMQWMYEHLVIHQYVAAALGIST